MPPWEREASELIITDTEKEPGEAMTSGSALVRKFTPLGLDWVVGPTAFDC